MKADSASSLLRKEESPSLSRSLVDLPLGRVGGSEGELEIGVEDDSGLVGKELEDARVGGGPE